MKTLFISLIAIFTGFSVPALDIRHGKASPGSHIENSIDAGKTSIPKQDLLSDISNAEKCNDQNPDSVSALHSSGPQIYGPLVACATKTYHYISQGDSLSSFTWTVQGGFIHGNPHDTEIDITWTDTVFAQIKLTETNYSGQSIFVYVAITVYALPVSEIHGKNSACITPALSYYTTSNQPGVLRHWNLDGGGSILMNGTDSIGIEWNQPGDHLISLRTVSIYAGCDSTTSFVVHVDSIPMISFPAPNLSVCAPYVLQVHGNNPLHGYHYDWHFGDSTGSTDANPLHNYIGPGDYSVSLIVNGRFGCADTATSVIHVKPSAQALFSVQTNSDTNYAGSTTFSFTNNSIGAYTYQWNFGDGNLSNVNEPDYVYGAAGTFTVTLRAIASSGCVDSMTKIVEVISPEIIFVPSAFSPNGDNVNDYFSVVHNNIRELKITVYNEWGQLIFTSAEPDFHWDGIFHGRLIDQGLYGYRIQATGTFGENFDLQGKLTVLR